MSEQEISVDRERLVWSENLQRPFSFSFLFSFFLFLSFLFCFCFLLREQRYCMCIWLVLHVTSLWCIQWIVCSIITLKLTLRYIIMSDGAYMKYLLCIACTNCCSASDNISVATVPVLTNVHTLWETACLVSFHLGILPFIAPLSLSNSLEGEVLTKKGWKENGLIIRWQNNRNNFDKPMKVYLTSSVI